MKKNQLLQKTINSIALGFKVCNNCFELKSHSDFSKHSGCGDGRRPNCKKCKSQTEYQRRLEKMSIKNRLVKSCDKCDLLFSAHSREENFCIRCRF